MRIAHLTSELNGGAGIAALRLHSALLEQDLDSHLFHMSGASAVPQTERFIPRASKLTRYLDRAMDQWVWKSRKIDAGPFMRTRRFSRGGIAATIAGADVVHLHWIAKWLDLPALFDAIQKSTPI